LEHLAAVSGIVGNLGSARLDVYEIFIFDVVVRIVQASFLSSFDVHFRNDNISGDGSDLLLHFPIYINQYLNLILTTASCLYIPLIAFIRLVEPVEISY
jgi:hypothetical protein